MNKRWVNDSSFKAECEIISEKVSLGINGVEWLVQNFEIDEMSLRQHNHWIEFVKHHVSKDINEIMKNVLLMNANEFYFRYELNWWISVDETIRYLKLAKQRNYEWYFRFLNDVFRNEELKRSN